MIDLLLLALQVVVFACGMALLSYRFYAVYRRWTGTGPAYRAHLPGIFAIALMLFAIISASLAGWAYAVVTVIAGSAASYLYVHVLRLRVEAALLGPPLAALAVLSQL